MTKEELILNSFNKSDLKKLYVPPPNSHKGQNGKLLIIGGSHLFHAASLWSLKVASRIVDMVFYSSIPENNEIVQKAKEEFRDGIVVPRNQIDHYIDEADCILIGPGLPRIEGQEQGDDDTKELTERLLKKYSSKKWVIDGGSLQVIEPTLIPHNAILTPHKKEFETLFGNVIATPSLLRGKQSHEIATGSSNPRDDEVARMAKEYNCIILLKGQTDIVCPPRPPLGEAGSSNECVQIKGGNPGMTKGGTGDVLAGLVAALACKNDMFLAAKVASFVNKKAGDELYKRVGLYFNASDLADEIPKILKDL